MRDLMLQVFKEAGLHSPVLGSIVMGAINLGATLLAAALMDRAGRRLLLILSHSGMMGCLLLIAIVDFLPGRSRRSGSSIAGQAMCLATIRCPKLQSALSKLLVQL